MGRKLRYLGLSGRAEIERLHNGGAPHFWLWSGTARADGKQFPPDEGGGGAAQESAAGKDGVREIDMPLVFGGSVGNVHSPGGRLGEIEDEVSMPQRLA